MTDTTPPRFSEISMREEVPIREEVRPQNYLYDVEGKKFDSVRGESIPIRSRYSATSRDDALSLAVGDGVINPRILDEIGPTGRIRGYAGDAE